MMYWCDVAKEQVLQFGVGTQMVQAWSSSICTEALNVSGNSMWNTPSNAIHADHSWWGYAFLTV